MKQSIDMKDGDLDIYVDGELVLHIGQVSDEDIINLFLYPKGNLVESVMHHENPNSECTHEILKERE